VAGLSLRTRLAVVAVCLAAAGACVIGAAGYVLTKAYLVRQADRQLRSYAQQLASRPLTLYPNARLAPDATSIAGAAGRDFAVAVRDSAGALLMRAGPAVPSSAAGWVVISRPVRYSARRLLFAYGAQDSVVSVTSLNLPGQRASLGTLTAGVDLSAVSRQAAGRLLAWLAVTFAVLALLGGAIAWAIRRVLRPCARISAAAAGAAAGAPVRAMPDAGAGPEVGRIARSLTRALGRTADAGAALAESEAAATQRTARVREDVAAAGRQLRRHVSVLSGLAEYYRERAGHLARGDRDRVLQRVDDEAKRMIASLDQLDRQHERPSAG